MANRKYDPILGDRPRSGGRPGDVVEPQRRTRPDMTAPVIGRAGAAPVPGGEVGAGPVRSPVLKRRRRAVKLQPWTGSRQPS